MEDALKFYTRCMEKSQSFPDPCPLLWQLPFLRKNNLVALKPSLAGPRGKGIGPGISDFGFLVLLDHLPKWVIEIFMKLPWIRRESSRSARDAASTGGKTSIR